MRDGLLQPPPAIALPAELMVWLSPSFPVGSFAFSHGLELAVERGWIVGRAGLETWLADLLAHGGLRNDLILLGAAWENRDGSIFHPASVASDNAAAGKMEPSLFSLADINELALALQPSAERQLETVTQGSAFTATVMAAWPAAGLHALSALPAGQITYPVAVGAAAAAHGIARDGAALAYGVAFVSSLVSAAIRLSLIGQTDGQRVIAGLMPMLTEAAHAAALSTLDDLGSATFRADLACLLHETQYTRLFRS